MFTRTSPRLPRRAASAAVLATVLAALPAAGQRPNIVFLLADDHAAHAVSAYREHLRYGVPLPATPNLDRLAASGMLFRNAFATNSICGPSRATILTGQYGHLNGVMTNRESLHPATVTFPRLLHDAGYQTSLFGKWHLWSRPEGFDRFEILAGQGPYYNPALLTSSGDTVRATGYTLDVVTARALDWMRTARDTTRPFLMMLHFNAPHRFWDPGPDQLGLYRDTLFAEPSTFRDLGAGRSPASRDPEMTIAQDLFARDLKLEAPAGLTPEQQRAWDAAYGPENERLARSRYTAEGLTAWRYQRFIGDYMRVVASLDAQVGTVLDALDAAGLADSTLVIYTSDQGFFLGDHGWFDKRWMYEESIRMPLLARWPGVIRPGSTDSALVMNLDLAQTLLDAAGVAAPASMQGRSILPLLRGEAPSDWRGAIYYQYFEYPGWHSVRRQYGVRTQRYKLIHFYEVDEWELYDLARDPDELTSVYHDPRYRGVRSELRRTLRELRRGYAVPARDPVPYRPSDVPPEWRRPGAAARDGHAH